MIVEQGDYFVINEKPFITSDPDGTLRQHRPEFEGMVFFALEVSYPMVLAEVVERSKDQETKPLVMSLDSNSFLEKNEETGTSTSSLVVVSQAYGDCFRNSRKLDISSALDFGLSKEEIDLLNLDDNEDTKDDLDDLEF